MDHIKCLHCKQPYEMIPQYIHPHIPLIMCPQKHMICKYCWKQIKETATKCLGLECTFALSGQKMYPIACKATIGLVKQLCSGYGNWEERLHHFQPLIAAELKKPDQGRIIDEMTVKTINHITDPNLFVNAGAKVQVSQGPPYNVTTLHPKNKLITLLEILNKMQMEIEDAENMGEDLNPQLKAMLIQSCQDILSIMENENEDEVELEKIEKAAPCQQDDY